MSSKKDKDAAPPRQYTRREVIRRVAATSAVAVAGVGLGAGLSTREVRPAQAKLARIRDHRVPRATGSVELAIARSADPAANVRQVIEAMGGMASFVRKGERVAIKPNVGWNRMPEQAANTNPQVVAEVVRQALAAGAAEVWVTDNPVNDAERCFTRSGIADAAQAAGAKIVLPDKLAFRDVQVGGEGLRVAEVLWPIVDADRVINLPIVKQHGLSKATLSLKNWYGVIGGHRVRLHQDIHRSIVDLAQMVKPTLTILDATRILRANGPSGGSLDDVQQRNIVAAAVDEVALDAFGCTLLELNPREVGFVLEGERRELGTGDYKSLKTEEIGA